MTTPILGIQEIAEGIASQAALHNTALREIEARTIRVLSMSVATPPATPAEGDSYIIPVGSPIGWLGAANRIASYLGGAWSYYTPIEGVTVWVNDLNLLYTYDGAAWVTSAGITSPLTTKGDVYTFSTINARLGVGANDTVLTADTAQATGLKWAAVATSTVKFGGVSTNTGNDYTITPTPAVSTLTDGLTFYFRINATNTVGNARLTVGTSPIKSILKEGGVSLSAGDLVLDTVVMVTYLLAYDVYHLHRTSDAVRLTGAQTIAGIKTFSSSIVGTDATLATHLVTKSQLDAKVYAGQVTNAGTAAIPYGPSGWTVNRSAAGTVVLTHNLGTTNYAIVATPNTAAFTAIWGTLAANTVTILTYDTANALADTGFTFVLARN